MSWVAVPVFRSGEGKDKRDKKISESIYTHARKMRSRVYRGLFPYFSISQYFIYFFVPLVPDGEKALFYKGLRRDKGRDKGGTNSDFVPLLSVPNGNKRRARRPAVIRPRDFVPLCPRLCPALVLVFVLLG